MPRNLETTRGVALETAGEAVLQRLSALAREFGAEAIAAGAESLAERVSEGRF
jgi:EAL domain-containing protein (putative c-di-GMP-specific phosphodiesterase class I)